MYLVVGTLAGCAGQPFEYTAVDELPAGRGLFSDDSGTYVLYGEKNGKRNGEAAAAATTADSAATGDKARQTDDFEEFQAWKKNRQNSDEYREFEEWREWKEYQEWKRTRPGAE